MDAAAIDQVASSMQTSHPFIQEFGLPEALKSTYYHMNKWTGSERYTYWEGNKTAHLKTWNGVAVTTFAHYEKPQLDLWEDLVAPGLKSDLKVETWCQCENPNTAADACGFHCCIPAICDATKKSGGQRVSQIEYMVANIGNTSDANDVREWDSNFTHAKWGLADEVDDAFAPWVCLGDENRQHQVPTCASYGGQLTRGGGAACFQQARGRVRVGEEGYHLASLGPLPPPMAASQAFPECRYSSLPVASFCP